MRNVRHSYEGRAKNREGSYRFEDSGIPDGESHPLGMQRNEPTTDTSSPCSSRPRLNHYHATASPATATCRADASILPGPWQETRNQFYCTSVLAHSRRVWMQICFIRVSGIRRGPNTFSHRGAREPMSDIVKHTN